MRPLTLLPLLSNAYAQGQASITAEDSPDHPLGESEYNKVCANPSDNEVQVALGYFVRYYCDTYPQYWNDKIRNVPSIEACTLACSEIPGYKGALWKKKDATCWWSDHATDFETDIYTDAPGYVYMIIETNRALTGTWGKMLYYPQQANRVYTILNPGGTFAESIEQCTKLCLSKTKCKLAQYTVNRDKLYSNNGESQGNCANLCI
ncbi:hypothetical protein BDV35DRAFT_381510 [Aspergillus flavus]|uniref:Apple domain-containing protein n=1 Tax=Aspergillus flavus TaxID=5059 RepID=A0A5N6GSR9_ASPFL|nr:hypothetical protein BDV35DRAFT_381510 [Aspergillus flavus]